MDTYTSFIWIIIFFDTDFKYGSGLKFWGYIETNAVCIIL
jgi:hypothetical protein